jgi:hypothetical protein
MLRTLDRLRHRIPFWWWLTYDAAVAIVIALGVKPFTFPFWLGYIVLVIAVVIDAAEYAVKRPAARRDLDMVRHG